MNRSQVACEAVRDLDQLPNKDVSSYEMTKQYFTVFRQEKDFIENLQKSDISYLILKQLDQFLKKLGKSFGCMIECRQNLQSIIKNLLLAAFSPY